MVDLHQIRQTIARECGVYPESPPDPVAGGCINESFRLGDYFVKINSLAPVEMFETEYLGLSILGATGAIRTPRPVCIGKGKEHAFFILEYLPLNRLGPAAQERLGCELAALHRASASHFGWERDNYLGTTKQPNSHRASWMDFFRDQRLDHILQLARACGYSFRGADYLLAHLDRFFETDPPPCLLHGDLWAGNAGMLKDGTPVIFDPAVYFGDREVDLAMTNLFGGFSPLFQRAYQQAWPLLPGHENRFELYNLYHILNHAVLFGRSYAHQAQGMIDHLVARL